MPAWGHADAGVGVPGFESCRRGRWGGIPAARATPRAPRAGQAGPASAQRQRRMRLWQAPDVRHGLDGRLHRNTVLLAAGAHRLQVGRFAGDDGAPRPAPVRRQRSSMTAACAWTTASPRTGRTCTRSRAFGSRRSQSPPRQVVAANLVDADGTPRLHAAGGALDDRVDRRDDVRGGPVLSVKEGDPCAVGPHEAPDERNRGAAEGVDVLVVVPRPRPAERFSSASSGGSPLPPSTSTACFITSWKSSSSSGSARLAKPAPTRRMAKP